MASISKYVRAARLGIPVILAVLSFLVACGKNQLPEGDQPVPIADRSVCPQHGPVWIPGKQDTAWRQVSQLVVPGANTQIPEYHDCQRLLDKDKDGYTAEAGIYAYPGIVDLIDQLIALEQANQPLRAIAGAEIISTEDYDKLGIKLGANCLYLYTQQGQPRAFMRPVATESDCGQRLNPIPPQPGWTMLIVTEEPELAPFTRDDFSPSARWDHDARPIQNKQFIGLPCRNAYCLIGHQGAQSWKRYDRSGNAKARRVAKIRTWYDEQILGILPTGGGAVVPSGVFGTIFPDSGLQDRTEPVYNDVNKPWHEGATIRLQSALPYYKTKFNLEPTLTDNSFNRVFLCKGPSTRCIPAGVTPPNCTVTANPWYAKIISAVSGEVRYNCVVWHDHQGFPIPGNARWYWLPNDEGIWMRCPNGCCQVT
jgi:hypothetical protein